MVYWCLGYLMGHGLFFKLPILLNSRWLFITLCVAVLLSTVIVCRSNRVILSHLLLNGALFAWSFLFIYYQSYYETWRPRQGANWYLVEGVISEPVVSTNNLAKNTPIKLSFRLSKVAQMTVNNLWYLPDTFVRVNWYPTDRDKTFLKQGYTIRVKVKLKHIVGYENSAGFSYSQWLFSNHYVATGYVKGNVEIISNRIAWPQQALDKLISSTHQSFYQKYWVALTLGDKSLLTNSDKKWLQQMGIGHLLAISGLHIGIIYIALSQTIGWGLRFLTFKNPHLVKAAAALILLWLYLFLLGFVVSAFRAVLMVSLWVLLTNLFAYSNRFKVLAIVAVLSVTLQPGILLGAGWWLSFGAVMAILSFNQLFGFGLGSELEGQSFVIRCWNWSKQLFFLQLFITVCLFPIMAFWFSGFSLAGIIVNLVAIPVFSFLLVPLNFLLTVLVFISQDVFSGFYVYLDFILGALFNFINLIDNKFNYVTFSSLIFWICLPILLALACLPRLRNYRGLGLISCFVIVPTFLSRYIIFNSDNLPLIIRVMDVGQGTSVLLRQGDKLFVYDLGPVFRSGFSATEAVVAPMVTRLGMTVIDTVVVSHMDSDHKGNSDFIDDNFTVNNWLMGCLNHPGSVLNSGNWQNLQWQLLWPDLNGPKDDWKNLSDNNKSCVVKVTDINSSKSLLLSGDIGKSVEKILVKRHKSGAISLTADVLISPHHGSKYSSSMAFIKAVSPHAVVHAAGVYNRFGFPTKEVQQRYKTLGAKQFSTRDNGEVTISLRSSPLEAIEFKIYLNDLTPFWKRQNPFSIQQQIR